MKAMSTKEAKNAFGRLIDIARAQPVTIEEHGRGVVVVMAIEAYKQLLRLEGSTHSPKFGLLFTRADEGDSTNDSN